MQKSQSINEIIPLTVREIDFLQPYNKISSPHMVCLLRHHFLLVLGRCYTSPPTLYSKEKTKKTEPVIDVSDFQGGFEYSDAFLHDNDARFVFNFIRNAMDKGSCR